MISNISRSTRSITFHFKCHYLYTALVVSSFGYILHTKHEHLRKEKPFIILFLHQCKIGIGGGTSWTWCTNISQTRYSQTVTLLVVRQVVKEIDKATGDNDHHLNYYKMDWRAITSDDRLTSVTIFRWQQTLNRSVR